MSADLFLKPANFLGLVEKCVFRTKINQKFKDELLKLKPEDEIDGKAMLKLLKFLFDDQMEHLYGSPDELLDDIFKYQRFPDNADFLGIKDSLNYNSIVCFAGKKGEPFISKSEAIVSFYSRNFAREGPFVNLTANFVGNEVGRELKSYDCFQLILRDYFYDVVMYEFDNCLGIVRELFPLEEMFNDKSVFNTILLGELTRLRDWNDEGKKHMREIFETEFELVEKTVDEVYEKFANLFDRSRGEENFRDLRELIKAMNKQWPIARNVNHYKELFKEQLMYRGVLRMYFSSDAFRQKSPIVRFIIDDDVGNFENFFFAKELTDALEIVLNNKYNKPFPKGLISIENEEERKMGILKTVNYETFEKVLKILKVSIDDLLTVAVPSTTANNRGNVVPINSPYGTYCKQAKHAFFDVFEQISVGMNLFQSIDKQHLPKVFEFFDKLTEKENVFGVAHDYRYFIETWKIDEIIDLAYQELAQYCTDDIYVFPNKNSKQVYTPNEALRELKRFSPNFDNQQKLVESYDYFIRIESQPISQKVLRILYEYAIRGTFIGCHPNLPTFMHNQLVPRQDRVKTSYTSVDKGKHYVEYAEKFREAIRKALPRISERNFIPKSEFDLLVRNEMAEDFGIVSVVTDEDKLAHFSISQLIYELFEMKRENQVVFFRRREKPMKMPDILPKLLAENHELCNSANSISSKYMRGQKDDLDEMEKFGHDAMRKLNQIMHDQSDETKESVRLFLDNLSLNSSSK